jgi:hypothetical protein
VDVIQVERQLDPRLSSGPFPIKAKPRCRVGVSPSLAASQLHHRQRSGCRATKGQSTALPRHKTHPGPHGWEILMFVRDGRLAVFPLSQSSACANVRHRRRCVRQYRIAHSARLHRHRFCGQQGSRLETLTKQLGERCCRPARSPTSSNRRRLLDQASMKNRTVMQQPSA